MAPLPIPFSSKTKSMDVTPLTINIEGCTKVDCFEVKEPGRKQYIFVVGEYHNYPGNSLQILKQITEKTNCPIHVLVEKEYIHSPELVSWPIPNSNLSIFHTDLSKTNPPGPNLRICTDPLKIPSKNIKYPKTKDQIDFYKQCIKPFKGNTKIWGIDLRWSGIFKILYILTTDLFVKIVKTEETLVNLYKSDPQVKIWFDNLIDLQESFLNFNEAIFFPTVYDGTIRLKIKTLFDPNLVPDVFKPYILRAHRPIEQIIEQKMRSKDKSYMSLIGKLQKISNPFYMDALKRYILPTLNIRHSAHVMMWSYIMDLEFIYRINKILQKEKKEGFIICFVGEEHRKRISTFLRKIPFAPGNYLFEFLKQEVCDPISHNSKIRIPMIGCTEKTAWMETYQKRMEIKRRKMQFQEAAFRYHTIVEEENRKKKQLERHRIKKQFQDATVKYLTKVKQQRRKKKEEEEEFADL